MFNLGTLFVYGSLDHLNLHSFPTRRSSDLTTGQPLDDQWHHIVFAQQDDGARKSKRENATHTVKIYAKEAGTLNVNDTTIGGILRASPGFWVTGLIDEVALWKRALTEAEIK